MLIRPVVVESDDQLVGLLRGRRTALGLFQPDVDDRAGFPEGYTAKLEAPHRGYGKRCFWGMTDFGRWWLKSLGLRLVLVDAATAEAWIAASTAPALEASAVTPNATREGGRPLVRKTSVRRQVVFLTAA